MSYDGVTVVVYTSRQYRNLKLTPLDAGRMRVSAPQGMPLSEVRRLLDRHRDAFHQLLSRRAAQRGDVRANWVRLLGRRCPVVRQKGAGRARASLCGERVVVSLPEGAPETACEQAVAALRDRLLTETLGPMIQHWQTVLGVRASGWTLRTMQTRWGDCQVKTGRLAFSRMLAEQPEQLIEYVVVHELCHLIHPDHSPAFWAQVERVMPDWRDRRRALNGRGRPSEET